MPPGEFLLEVRCEEIPARMLKPGIEELATRMFEELMADHVAPAEVITGFTPRRLALILRGMPERQPDHEEELLGPPVSAAFDEDGKPTQAARGFARRCGVGVGELRRVRTGKGEYVAAARKIEGRPTAELLADLTPRLLAGIGWAKTMRWGSGKGPWVRPVHGIVALFDGAVVPFELFGIVSGNTSQGHPLHSPRPFPVRDADDYRRKLARRGIVVDFERRRSALLSEMKRRAARLGGRLVEDPGLLDRLAAVCETPGVVEGSFEPEFLEMPREVLVATLRDHQSAFAVESAEATLPVFLTLMDRAEDPEGRVRAGNEWVTAARLADARFFYQEDRRLPLGERRERLEHLTFHAQLGSYADKTDRLVQLAGFVCDQLGWAEVREPSVAAAALLKADLTTEMVKEFTSLQGVMGGVYAREEGLPDEVWQAVYDQYLPAATDDPIPQGGPGRVASLADRIDTLVGIFGLGHVPTSSKDPFGLRRAAQGVVRIALEGGLNLDLDLVAAKAFQLYGDRLKLRGKKILEIWRPFLFDRVRYLLGLEGFAYDEIEAALAVGGTNLPDLHGRVEALHAARAEPGFLDAVLAVKRIGNIVKDSPEQRLDEQLLAEPAERELFEAFTALRGRIEELEHGGEYERCLRAIAGFAAILDRFFVEVLVMDENLELRNNRIGLLQSIQRVLSRTADLTRIVVDKAEYRQPEGPDEAPGGRDEGRIAR